LQEKNSVICNLFNFCPQSAQSRRNEGALVGLSPTNNAPSPPKLKYETL